MKFSLALITVVINPNVQDSSLQVQESNTGITAPQSQMNNDSTSEFLRNQHLAYSPRRLFQIGKDNFVF